MCVGMRVCVCERDNIEGGGSRWAARGKPGPAGVGAVLCNSHGVVLVIFSKHVGILEYTGAKVVANLEELRIFLSSFVHKLVIESGCSINTISWVSSSSNVPWRFQFYLNEIKVLVSSIQVEFQHVGSLTNNFADCLAKQGVDGSLRFGCFHYVIFYVCFIIFFPL